MPYLIDGHNLIGQMPDISLDDPNDEALLVQKLIGLMARLKKSCVVVFDYGLPGGTSRMSTRAVQVVFASGRSSADRVMIERISKIPDPLEWTVVSSDHEVLNSARARRMQIMRSLEFARMMQSPPKRDVDIGEAMNVYVSPEEVAEWLKVFGSEEEPPKTRNSEYALRPPIEHLERKPGKVKKADDKNARSNLSVDEWLEFFKGDDGAQTPSVPPEPSGPAAPAKPQPASQPPKMIYPNLREPVKSDKSLVGGEEGEIAGRIFLRVGLFVEEHGLGRLTNAETGYILKGQSPMRGPDVGFISIQRAPKGLPKGLVPFAPDLAVEIITPDERVREALLRVERYLEAGTRIIWVVYPDDKCVDVWHRASDGSLVKRQIGIDGTLDGEDVLPNFRLPLRSIFPK
jgi:hypothetical protein